MTELPTVGIGELLRHLSDLFDRDAERIYTEMETGLKYRARYTPVLRCFAEDPLTITELQQRLRITQGAVSQTVKLMEAEGLLRRVAAGDNRIRRVTLSEKGRRLRDKLSAAWALHLQVIAELEAEIGIPLRSQLVRAIAALEQESYYERILAARARLSGMGPT